MRHNEHIRTIFAGNCSSCCGCLDSTHTSSRGGPVAHTISRMLELTGRRVRLLGLKSQGQVQSRCLRCCRRSAPKRERAACTAYRNDLEQTSEQGKAPARSRLLSAKTRPQQQEAPSQRGRLFRRTQTSPVPEPDEEAPRASGRLLQRSKPISTTSNGLTRATDTLRRSQQDKNAVRTATQQSDAKHKRLDKRVPSNQIRFSQEAGKLSQKDWQVRNKHWTPTWPGCLISVPG